MDDDRRSNIARAHDAALADFEAAGEAADKAAAAMRETLERGGYGELAASAARLALHRHDTDPEFFLIFVQNGMSAPAEVLASDNGLHGMDGRNLPREEGRELANALARRNKARKDMRDNWDKMSEAEREARTRP